MSKIHGRLHFSCILIHFGIFFCKIYALGPPRATQGGSRAVPWASAEALGRLPGRSGKPFWKKKWFLEMFDLLPVLPIIRSLWRAQKLLRALPAPFGTCHDAFGTCFVARAQCKKSGHFGKCVKSSHFPEKNAGFNENWYFLPPPDLQNS